MKINTVMAATALVLLAEPGFGALNSSYDVSGRQNDGTAYTGTVKIAASGQVYRLDYCCERQFGVAIEYQDFLAVSYTNENDKNKGDLNLYRRTDNGWIGAYTDYTDGGLSVEVLSNKGDTPDVPDLRRARSRKPIGKYRMSGTNPNGSTYTGEVEIGASADAFDVSRKIGRDEASGTAITFDGALAINVNGGDQPSTAVVGLFVPEGNGFMGVWTKGGGQRLGAERWARE
jgi:hypothetical protein